MLTRLVVPFVWADILMSHKNRTHSSPRLFAAASLYIAGIRKPVNMRLSALFLSQYADTVGTLEPIEAVRFLPSHSFPITDG